MAYVAKLGVCSECKKYTHQLESCGIYLCPSCKHKQYMERLRSGLRDKPLTVEQELTYSSDIKNKIKTDNDSEAKKRYETTIGNDQHFLIRSIYLDNWYVIKPVGGEGIPEGRADEWKMIANAMLAFHDEGFERVAVNFDNEKNAWLFSPRNSPNIYIVRILYKEVDKWARRALKIIAAYES